MAEEWKCLFCDALNASNTTTCAQCEKANTAIVHINQICLCGRKLIECPVELDQCYVCCKETEKKEKGYYVCRVKQCTCIQMRGNNFRVCSACYESTNTYHMDSKHCFLFCKIASMMERIKKETERCKDNDERRRYMFWVYCLLHTNCIAKLAQFMNESEHKQIQDMFDAFYGEVMDEIKQNIDSNALGLASHMFVNKKKMKRKEWIKTNKISLKWQMLADEHKYEKEKDEKVNEVDDVRCGDITKCQTRKRVHLVMRFYKEYFLTRFVYGEDDADEMQYIQIFENAFDGYNATDLLNDYFHIQS
eukprot:682127_1